MVKSSEAPFRPDPRPPHVEILFPEMSGFSSDDSADEVKLDLFGQPIQPIKDRRGRPSYAKSTENQVLVTVLRAANWSHERIARILGCDEKTLRKYYSRELDAGADLVEAETLMVNYQKMRQGNSAAIGRLLDIVGETALALPHGARKVPAAKEPKLGKKEQLVEDAHSGHRATGWGELLQ